MATTTAEFAELTRTSARILQRAFAIGETRLALLTLELQEEGGRLVASLLNALLIAACALLALMSASAAVVVVAWPFCPVTALLLLTALYLAAGTILYRRLMRRLRAWRSFAATMEQLRKDRACLDHMLG
jgi:uncharacterized membrane protein YqjE